jgi:hypothetical protein
MWYFFIFSNRCHFFAKIKLTRGNYRRQITSLSNFRMKLYIFVNIGTCIERRKTWRVVLCTYKCLRICCSFVLYVLADIIKPKTRLPGYVCDRRNVRKSTWKVIKMDERAYGARESGTAPLALALSKRTTTFGFTFWGLGETVWLPLNHIRRPNPIYFYLFIYTHIFWEGRERAIYIHNSTVYIYHIRKIFVYLGTVISLHRSRRFLWDAIFSFFFQTVFLILFRSNSNVIFPRRGVLGSR